REAGTRFKITLVNFDHVPCSPHLSASAYGVILAEKKSLLRRLLGGIWRTVVVFYMLLFLVLVIAVPVAVYVLFFSAPEIEVPQHSVLIWEPNGQLVASRDRDDNVIAGLLAQPRPVS